MPISRVERRGRKKRSTPPAATVYWEDGQELARIPLTQGKEAIIDARDVEWATRHIWHASKDRSGFYARRFVGTWPVQKSIKLHKEVYEKHLGKMNPGFVTDHINRITLDNRLSNLRAVTGGENRANGISRRNRKYYLPKGVHPNRKKFRAQIFVNGKYKWLGSYQTPEEASAVYEKSHKELYGL